MPILSGKINSIDVSSLFVILENVNICGIYFSVLVIKFSKIPAQGNAQPALRLTFEVRIIASPFYFSQLVSWFIAINEKISFIDFNKEHRIWKTIQRFMVHFSVDGHCRRYSRDLLSNVFAVTWHFFSAQPNS